MFHRPDSWQGFLYIYLFHFPDSSPSVLNGLHFYFSLRDSASREYEEKAAQKKQPEVRTLSTRRRFVARKPIESQSFSTRGKLLSSLHRSKRLKEKYLHACCWIWTFPRAMSKLPSFSRRCNTATGHGALARRSNFFQVNGIQQCDLLRHHFLSLVCVQWVVCGVVS